MVVPIKLYDWGLAASSGPQQTGHKGSSPVRRYTFRAHVMHHHVVTEGSSSTVISPIASL